MTRLLSCALIILSFIAGYFYPRDLELESTRPIVLSYEITPDAARILVFKYAEVQGVKNE